MGEKKPCYISRQALISFVMRYNGEQERSAGTERAMFRSLCTKTQQNHIDRTVKRDASLHLFPRVRV